MSEYRKTLEKLIKDVLGDFPQGFNAGATAGLLGWPGDMAMMADTAHLALSGERSQRPPEEYPLTTEAIAAAAGYPVPKSVSGQLGAAVGGLLSPSPGDLAKFAPLLSAIPFWHGSPHKFEAFDLAHMGKGEGAQAYGWGAYGTDTPAVAKEYAAMEANYKRMTGGLAPDTEFALDLLQKGMSEPQIVDNFAYKYGTNTDFDRVMAAINEAKSELSSANVYRGEYAWPDPAKEAASPLSGEDLLQWDKPLREQPKIVQILRDNGMWDGPGKWGEATTAKGQDLVAIMEAKRGEKGAADFLKNSGIPGIRYLDGQSRDGGSGTYNYVMFDDRGIKLLERNGKPIKGLLK